MDIFLALSIMYAGFIFGASSIPAYKLPHICANLDPSLVHGLVYAGLSILIFLWRYTGKSSMGASLFQGTVFASFYGLLDEIHLHFVQGRRSQPSDWIADVIGAFLGATTIAIIFLIVRYVKKYVKHA